MAKILYSATTADGAKKNGFVSATTAAEAVAKLKAEGFHDIQLHEEPLLAAQRFERDDLDVQQAECLAQLELQGRHTPGFKTILWEVARHNRWSILLLIGLSGFGLAKNDLILPGIGILLLAFTFGKAIWENRRVDQYHRLLSALALGHWEEARKLLDILQQGVTIALVRFDLSVRKAKLLAREGCLAQALADLEPWRAELDQKSPGLFDARLAEIYASAHDYLAFTACMRKAWEASGHDPSRALDLALAEARFGDPTVAADLMAKLDTNLIPVFGRAFVLWTHGIIALRQNNETALSHLAQATNSFLENASNPAVWTALIVCTGDYALALAQHNRIAEAEKLLVNIWPLLELHTDSATFATLQQFLPSLAKRPL